MSDAAIDHSGIAQLLGRHQREAARRREQQLQDTGLSLYRRLGIDSAELADQYDQTYGRPVDEDARVS